jgi:general stress protein 26
MTQMTKADVLNFMRTHSLAVQSSVSLLGGPQSAVIGFVVSDDFHIFFDTIDTTRKAKNLRQNPMIAFVIGGLIGGDERTVQYEGIADEPTGKELDSLKELYFTRFPDGRERQSLTGLIYIRAKPIWIRYSDFNQDPAEILEFAFGKQANGG